MSTFVTLSFVISECGRPGQWKCSAEWKNYGGNWGMWFSLILRFIDIHVDCAATSIWQERWHFQTFLCCPFLESEGTGNWKWDAQGESEHSAAIFGNLLDDLKRQPKALAKRNCKLGLLATPFGEGLDALTLPSDDLRSVLSRSNLNRNRRKFNGSWVTSIKLLSPNRDLPWNGFFCWTCVYFTRNLWVSSGPPTQVLLATPCEFSWLGLKTVREFWKRGQFQPSISWINLTASWHLISQQLSRAKGANLCC